MTWYTDGDVTMIFKLFQSKGKLGVDIGTHAIKIVELGKESGRFSLLNYGIFAFPETGTGTTPEERDAFLTQGIKQLIEQCKFSSVDAVAALPPFSLFTTVIEMPYLSEDDLAKAIPFEARKYVPIPLSEVVLDWSIIGVNEAAPGSTTPPTVEIFIAAVPREETARYQAIMQAAGLNLVALELQNTGLIRGLLGNDLSPTAVVDIGGRGTTIIVVNKGYERVNRSYEVGSFEITKSIAHALNISAGKAEDLKMQYGMREGDDNVVRDSIISLVDLIVFETSKTIAGYEESKNTKIGRVVLTGGLVNMPSFVEYFTKRLARDVIVGNAFSRVVFPQQLAPVIQELSNTLAVATGLAMREES
ncbi:MAG: type IV pilus assembly protein PilM [Patescibacteria group bacterium]